MRTSLLAASLLLASNAFADTGFERVVGGVALDRGVYASPTSDGGYVAVGSTESFGVGDEDIYLVRTDSEGAVLWTKTYGGSGNDNAWSVQEAEDGFVLAGFTRSFGEGGFDFYLLKTDSDGELEWSKTYGGEADDRCWALALTSDGGFALAGETASVGAGERDCYLVKTDSLGVLSWSRSYGGVGDDRCFSLVQAVDGGYMLAGQTYSEGAGDRDAYIIRTDSGGEQEWSRTFGGVASDVGHSIIETADGGFVVTGYTTSFATAGDDPYLIKIDVHGETRWTRVLPLEGSNHSLTGAQATDGGLFLVGFTEYPRKNANAALLIKTDAEGQLDWSKDILLTSTGRSLGYTVRSTVDGGCVFAGHTTVGSSGDLDLLLVKIAGQVDGNPTEEE